MNKKGLKIKKERDNEVIQLTNVKWEKRDGKINAKDRAAGKGNTRTTRRLTIGNERKGKKKKRLE